MGEAPSGVDEALSGEMPIGMPDLENAVRELANRHELTPTAELEDLIDHLFGLSCRDQEQNAFDPPRMAARRRAGFALAKSMRADAAAMLAALERLHRNWRAFDDEVRTSPALLEAIFDVDVGGPEELCLPQELDVLQTLFRTTCDDDTDAMIDGARSPVALDSLSTKQACPTGLWEAIDSRLHAVAELPVRSRLPKGPVPNMVVRAAVDACRSYWVALGLSWSMAGLKVASVRQDNVVANLTGQCERFVADALTTAAVRFNLSELHGAWEYVDATVRKPPGADHG